MKRLKHLVAALVMCSFAPAASATEQPPLQRADLPLIFDQVGVSNVEQQQIVALALADYADGYRAIFTALRQDTAGQKLASSIAMAVRARQQADALTRDLAASLNAVFDARQQLLFDTLWRTRLRVLRLAEGTFAGERTDLEAVLHATPGATETLPPPVRQRLTRWAYDMNQALEVRHAFDVDAPALLTMAVQTRDHQRAVDWARRAVRAHEAVRLVNDEAIDDLARLLGDSGSAFRTAALQLGYPRVFRSDAVDRVLIAARAGEAEDVRAFVEQVAAAYVPERERAREHFLGLERACMGLLWLAPFERAVGDAPTYNEHKEAQIAALVSLRMLELAALREVCEALGPDACAALNGGVYPLPEAPEGWAPPFPEPRPTPEGDFGPEGPSGPGDPLPQGSNSGGPEKPFPGPDPNDPDPGPEQSD